MEDSGPQNIVFLRVKWLGPATKGSSFVRWVRPRSVPFACDLFLLGALQCAMAIVLEWLHESCMGLV